MIDYLTLFSPDTLIIKRKKQSSLSKDKPLKARKVEKTGIFLYDNFIQLLFSVSGFILLFENQTGVTIPLKIILSLILLKSNEWQRKTFFKNKIYKQVMKLYIRKKIPLKMVEDLNRHFSKEDIHRDVTRCQHHQSKKCK